jgi:hypothetical protein
VRILIAFRSSFPQLPNFVSVRWESARCDGFYLTPSEHFFHLNIPVDENKTSLDCFGGTAVIDRILISQFVTAEQPGTALARAKFARAKP